MLIPAMLTIPTLVLPLVIAPTRDCQFGRMGDPAADRRALTAFEVAINDYADLQRRLKRAWPAAWLSADAENREFAAEQLRRALTDARPYATQGALFTPAVADVFRFRIATALRRDNYDTAAMGSPLNQAAGEGEWKPAVNGPLPWGTAGTPPWLLLAILVPLPPELEYRVIGRDLVLLDIHANLIVDTIDLALPDFATTSGGEEVQPAEEDSPDCLYEPPPDSSDPEESPSLTE